MSSFKNYWSSIKYHAITRPSIDIARKAVGKTGRIILKKFGRQPRDTIRKNVMHQTRSKIAYKLGAPTTNKSVFSKRTKTGQQNRAAAANYAKYIQRPKRGCTGNIRAITP